MQRTTSNDGRRYKRWEILEYALISRGDDANEPAVVVDLSLGGLQVRSKVNYEAGDQCMVSIARENDEPIVVPAEVRYSREDGHEGLFTTGMRFVPSSVEQRIALVHYIHDRFLADMERLAV